MNTRPYVVTGLKYIYNLNSLEGKSTGDDILLFRTKRNNIHTEFGIGMKRKLKRLYVSAELKAVMGLNNLKLPGEDYSWGGIESESYYNAIDKIRFRGLIFSLVIE